jgi:hypothetical protein
MKTTSPRAGAVTPERALLILQEIFAHRVHNAFANLQVQLAFKDLQPADATAMATLTRFEAGEILDIMEQRVTILPCKEPVDVNRYRTFVEATVKVIERSDLEGVPPGELLFPNLIRVPSLRSMSDFERAISTLDVRMELLASVEILDFLDEECLPTIHDPHTQKHLWALIESGIHFDSRDPIPAAEALVRENRVEAIPALLRILKRWQAVLVEAGVPYRLTEDERNLDIVLARILEPLLRKARSPEEQRQLDDLAAGGMFDEPS